jgi:LmbE family N-acetylglucosaminyl deacetylase
MDDEILGCGGTIPRHVDDGDDAQVCVVCNRAYGKVYDVEAIGVEFVAWRSTSNPWWSSVTGQPSPTADPASP